MLYQDTTNFFETFINQGLERVFVIEWE